MNRTYSLFTAFGFFFLTMAQAQNYDIYVSDAGNFSAPPWQILKYDQNGENGEVFISERLGWPQDILFLEEHGQVLISNLNTDSVNTHDPETGEYTGTFATEADGPTRMKIGPDGDIYLLQWNGTGLALRYDLDGNYLGEFTQVGVPRSIGLDWDGEGNLYIASYNLSKISRFDPNGDFIDDFISTGLSGPTNIWFGEGDTLFINNYNVGNVLRYDSDGTFIDVFISPIGQPEGVSVLGNGDLLIGDGVAGAVKKYDSDGEFIEEIISSQPLNLLTPNAVVTRDTEPTGTVESERYKEVAVKPVPGDSFTLISKRPLGLDKVTVIDSSGKTVHSDRVASDVVWDATAFPEGTYTLRFQLKNGDELTRKVIVSH